MGALAASRKNRAVLHFYTGSKDGDNLVHSSHVVDMNDEKAIVEWVKKQDPEGYFVVSQNNNGEWEQVFPEIGCASVSEYI